MTTSAQTLANQFASNRRVSTPILVVRTSDQSAAAACITAANEQEPIIQWDIASGFQARTEKPGGKVIELIMKGGNPAAITNPVEALSLIVEAPARTVVIVYNAHRLWTGLQEVQAMWNLRDLFKANKRTLVLMATPEARVAREIESDAIIIDDPLPDDLQLADIIRQQCEASKPELPIPPGIVTKEKGEAHNGVTYAKGQILPASPMAKFVHALKGLSAFVAEQVVALALRKVTEANPHGISLSELWERKMQAVEQTPGANIYRGKERFADIGGHAGLKRNLQRVINSKRPIRLVVIYDEFEKMSAGAVGDTSGVSQDQQQQVLTFMQNRKVRGIILMGHPGAGKTIVAKAMANEADCLCIEADMGAMKGSLIGESEARTRAFYALVDAIAGEGGAFFVATCNSTAPLTTEIRRRFKNGFYFVDLPTAEEKAQLWSLKLKAFGLDPKAPRPDDTNWTGAEIETCCEMADDYGISLVEAATMVVPVAQAQPHLITSRRDEAHGTMLSAVTGTTYQKPGREKVTVPTDAWIAKQGVRSVDLPGGPVVES